MGSLSIDNAVMDVIMELIDFLNRIIIICNDRSFKLI